MWNYSKLAFNTKYPWEAEPVISEVQPIFSQAEHAIKNGEVDSQQYVLRDITSGEIQRANVTFWSGKREDILYRRQFFNYNLDTECHWMQAMNLADFTVPCGIMRVDKMRLFKRPVAFTLGSYGFPDNGTQIITRECGKAKAIILKGTDFTGKERQLAMTIYDGWDEINLIRSTGTNPDSENSIVVYAYTERMKQYGGHELYLLISQVITKESHEDFTEEELFPVDQIVYEDTQGVGAYGTTTLRMKDGSLKKINYEDMEAKMML